MRTTLTLEDDVAALLLRLRDRRKASLKTVVNEALRKGLQQIQAPSLPQRRRRTTVVSLGNCLPGNLDDVTEVLAIAEGENFR
ncbi:MAG: DUF2191 domain-containing protein [Acidobacteria bacterium]|nr:MAG: DUF2191 domain-containing protein [Acidobacteriota bacterium]